MPLFGSGNDARLIGSISREIMHKFLSMEVEIFKLSLNDTETNLYGESSKKTYYSPVRAFALIGKEDMNTEDTDTGIDVTQIVSFNFLRSDLVDLSIGIEEGDIIKFDEKYYEVDNTRTTQYWAGRNQETFLFTTEGRDREFGLNVGIVAKTHLTRLSQLHITEIRSGINTNKTTNYTPKNL